MQITASSTPAQAVASTQTEVRPARTAGAAQGLALIFISAMPTMAIVSLVPSLPELLSHFKGTSLHELLVPMIITVPSLCIALFSPIAGAIADFAGRRRLLLVAALFYTVVGVLPVLLDNLYAILGTRFLVGIAEAAILTAQNALMGDYFGGARRQHWLGLLSIIGPVAAALLMLTGGFLGSITWHGPFFLYLLGLPMALWAYFVIYEPEERTDEPLKPPKTSFPWTAARIVALVTVGVSILYYIQAIQLGRIFADHGVSSTAQISIYVSTASLGVMLGGFAFSRMTATTISTRFTIVFLSLAVGYVGLGLTRGAAVALPFALIAQFGNGMTLPTLIGWALGKFDFEHRGRGMGVWGACFFVGTFLSPLFVTLLGTFANSFLGCVTSCGAICLLVALTIWLKNRASRNGAVDAVR